MTDAPGVATSAAPRRVDKVPCDDQCESPLCNCGRCLGPLCFRPPAAGSKFCAVHDVTWGAPVLTKDARNA